MTLYRLLVEREEEILNRCRESVMDALGDGDQLKEGLPALYGELVEVMRISHESDALEARQRFVWDTVTERSSREQAERFFGMGFSVSQLVHGYGAICQGVIEYAHAVEAKITAMEFGQLNFCLDVAIAQSVTAYQKLTVRDVQRASTVRLGETVHELRNALTGAILAHEMIRSGDVGAKGATSHALTHAHRRMTDIIDRAVADIRLGNVHPSDLVKVNLFATLVDVETASMPDANAKDIRIRLAADIELEVAADRHLLTSALANLVHNAVKFSEKESSILIRAYAEDHFAVIEVEDRCGGLDESTLETMFERHTQYAEDKSGMGLGLSIARRAVEQINGEITVRNLPGKGCIFTVRLPILTPAMLAELIE